jgi:hypothetical protein
MTADDFRAQCTALLNQLLEQGFQRPIVFAAIAMDGLTTSGSSETVTGTVPPLVKTDDRSGAQAIYVLPIHVLCVDPKGKGAYINSL